MNSKTTAALFAVAAALTLSRTAVAAETFVACPVEQLDAAVTTPLPQHWWSTPQRGELLGTQVSTIAGRKVLVCNYRGFATKIEVMRDIPAGFEVCKAAPGGFRCAASGKAQGDGSVRIQGSSNDKSLATQARHDAPTRSRDIKVTTQARAEAPTQQQSVTAETQLRANAPVVGDEPTKATPPTKAKSNEKLQQEALDERTNKAVKGITGSRVYPVGAEISLIGDAPLSPPGSSPVTAFCNGSADSRFGIVRLRYEWRPDEGYVSDGLLILRRSGGEVSTPVRLGPGSGQVEAGRATAPLTGLLTLSKADLCPSGCTEARLAPRSAADANRFDQRWQRACLRGSRP